MTRYSRGPVVAEVHANGEIIEHKEKQRRAPRSGELGLIFLMIDEEAALLSTRSLSPAQIRILFYVLADYREREHYSRLSTAEIARQAELSLNTVYPAIAALRDRRFLIKIGDYWMVNPHYGWRGSRQDWAAARVGVEGPVW